MKSAAPLTAVATCVMIALGDARGLRQDARNLRTEAGYQVCAGTFPEGHGTDSIILQTAKSQY